MKKLIIALAITTALTGCKTLEQANQAYNDTVSAFKKPVVNETQYDTFKLETGILDENVCFKLMVDKSQCKAGELISYDLIGVSGDTYPITYTIKGDTGETYEWKGNRPETLAKYYDSNNWISIYNKQEQEQIAQQAAKAEKQRIERIKQVKQEKEQAAKAHQVKISDSAYIAKVRKQASKCIGLTVAHGENEKRLGYRQNIVVYKAAANTQVKQNTDHGIHSASYNSGYDFGKEQSAVLTIMMITKCNSDGGGIVKLNELSMTAKAKENIEKALKAF